MHIQVNKFNALNQKQSLTCCKICKITRPLLIEFVNVQLNQRKCNLSSQLN